MIEKTTYRITFDCRQLEVAGATMILMYILNLDFVKDAQNILENLDLRAIFDGFLDILQCVQCVNLLYGDKSLRSLKLTINEELRNVSSWLMVNNLSLNVKKSNLYSDRIKNLLVMK